MWRDDLSMPVVRDFRLSVVLVFPWDDLCLIGGVVSWFPRWYGFQGSHAMSMLKDLTGNTSPGGIVLRGVFYSCVAKGSH